MRSFALLLLALWACCLERCVAGNTARKQIACASQQKDIPALREAFLNPASFCKWYGASNRVFSPVSAISKTDLLALCQCINADRRLIASATETFKPQTTSKVLSVAVLDKHVAAPLEFCTFWFKDSDRSSQGSPFLDLTVAAIDLACKIVTASPKVETPLSTVIRTSVKASSLLPSAHATTSFRRSSSTRSSSPSPPLSHSPTSRRTTTSANPNPTANLIPAVNAGLDRSNLQNLVPTKELALFYAEPTQNKRKRDSNAIAIINFAMYQYAIDLENSTYITAISCTNSSKGTTLSFTLANNAAAVQAVKSWPQQLVLVAYSCSCNPSTERGVYVSTSWSATNSVYTFNVVSTVWSAVASTAKVTYGTSPNTVADPLSCSPSSTSVSYVTMPTAITDLSPAAQSLLSAIVSHFQYANNDTVIMSMPVVNATIALPNFSPNATLSPAVEAALEAAGLDPPSAIANTVRAALAGVCGLNGIGNIDVLTSAKNNQSQSSLSKRDFDWDLAGEIASDACQGIAIVASKGEEDGEGCDGLDDAAQMVGCLVDGCYTTAITGYQYTFDDEWSASTAYPADSIVWALGNAAIITCINCALDMSKIVVLGELTMVLSTGAVSAATMAVSEATTADMVLRLQTLGKIEAEWDAALSTINMQAANIEGLFTITPTVVVAFGAWFSTDSAVDMTAGASYTWTNASTNVNIGSRTATNMNGWQPQIDVTYPGGFSTPSTASLIPYLRRTYSLEFVFLGNNLHTTVTFASQSAIGFTAQFLNAAEGTCKANQLRLDSYVGNTQIVVFPGNVTQLLNSQNTTNQERCFSVPAQMPSTADLASLSAQGQAFCTSYIGYVAPTVGVYTTAQSNVKATEYFTSTSTVTSTPTVVVTTTTLETITRTRATLAFATTAGTGTEKLASQYLKRDFPSASRPTKTNELHRRAIATPAFINNWPATEISYACSRIATGTITSTFTTSTATITVSTINSTSTVYVPTVGTPSTSTWTSFLYTWSTTTTVTSTSTVPSACPIQTQESCFTITGHGYPSIEGRQLGLYSDIDVPSFNVPATSFYIDCNGALVSLPDLRVLSTSNTSEFLSFEQWQSVSNPAICAKDVVQKTITCQNAVTGSNVIWIPQFAAYWLPYHYAVRPRDDPRLFMPMWADQTIEVTNGTQMQSYPITFSYDETTCPCGTPSDTAVNVYNQASPVCPSADDTTYTVSKSGNTYQIQCATDYCCDYTDTVQVDTFEQCIAACDAQSSNYGCFGVVWMPEWNPNCRILTWIDSVNTGVFNLNDTSDAVAAILITPQPVSDSD
ncbi:hypothetical protein ANO11243_042410 [Dothideomycetidae sp. 11243]|nr:hypothetical protein ANO11243_042410 [fungal sp. No.11243]